MAILLIPYNMAAAFCGCGASTCIDMAAEFEGTLVEAAAIGDAAEPAAEDPRAEGDECKHKEGVEVEAAEGSHHVTSDLYAQGPRNGARHVEEGVESLSTATSMRRQSSAAMLDMHEMSCRKSRRLTAPARIAPVLDRSVNSSMLGTTAFTCSTVDTSGAHGPGIS